MGELRQKFEALEQVAFIIDVFTFNEVDNEYEAPPIVPEYTAGVVNGMWIMFQEQQLRIEQLEKELAQMKHINDEQNKNLETAFKTIHIQQKFDADSQGAIACLTEINEQLEKKLKAVNDLLDNLKDSMEDFKEFDLYDKGHRVTTNYIVRDLEEALRGGCE